MKRLDFEPTDNQVQEWVREHAHSDSTEPVTVFVARKAAWYAADIELAAWSKLMESYQLMHGASRFTNERRPPAPKAVIYQNGYAYHLAPGQ